MSNVGDERKHFTWVLDDEGIGQLKEAIVTAVEVSFDTETTGLRPHAVQGGLDNGGVGARVVLATFTLPQKGRDGEWDGEEPTTWILPLSHPEGPHFGRWRNILGDVLRHWIRYKVPMIAHNGKFDVNYCSATVAQNLVELLTWDTADGARVLDPGWSAKLGDACERELGVPSWKDFDFTTPGVAETYPLIDLGEYGARDTYYTWKLSQHQRRRMFLLSEGEEPFDSEEILNSKLGKLATWVSMPTVASLSQMEQNGLNLDIDYCRDNLKIALEESHDALVKIAELGGSWGLNPDDVSVAPTSHWFRDFTEAGLARNELKIIELTPKGKPSWSKSALNKMSLQGSEVAKLILHQRHYTKRKEFLSSWLAYVSPDGKIHSTYNTGMITGRLSSSGPNMQQVTKSLRPCFVPSPGFVIADFDFSQIELRIAAFISRSQPMLDAFNNDEDLHRLLAAEVTGKHPSEVTDTERQMAKAVNFGLLFGLGAFGLQGYAENSYGVTMSRDEATAFYHAYFRKWSGLKEWHAQVEARLMRDGFSISPLSRMRRFNGTGKNDLNAAINAPVQGMASDLMQMAIADIQGLLPAGMGRGRVEGVRAVGTVHDSVVMELPEDSWREKALEVQQRMEDLNPLLKRLDVQLDVPIRVEAVVGTRWSLKDVGEIDGAEWTKAAA